MDQQELLALGAPAFRLASRILGSDEGADDVVQQAYLAALREMRAERQPTELRTWFLTVVANCARNELRGEGRRRRREQAVRPVSAPRPDGGVDAELVAELRSAMAALDEQYRVPVALCCEEGLTQREAAAILDMPESTVSKYVRLGLDRLRDRLAKAGYAAVPAAVAAALVHTAPVMPTALTSALAELVSSAIAGKGVAAAGLSKAGSAAALKGGLIVKIGLGIAAVGLAAGVSLVAMSGRAADAPAGGLRQEKDASGQEWALTDWREGERPYKKALAEREAEYLKKWGEGWRGAPHKSQGGNYIMSPGVWKWEEFTVIPDSRKASPGTKGASPRWEKSQANVFAPGGGEEVTAVWSVTDFGIYHVDAKTKQSVYAGVFPTFTYEADKNKVLHVKFAQPMPEPVKDGLDGAARLQPSRNPYGNWLTVDSVTGRVYFVQGTVPDGRGGAGLKSPNLLRYAEELRPYTVGGKEMLLPAILDYKEMYKKVGAEPVMKDGKRAPARIAIRTTPVNLGKAQLPSIIAWGRKVIVSPEGVAYFEVKPTYPNTLNEIHAFEIDTGKDLGIVPLDGKSVPKDLGAHGGTTGSFDGFFYECVHPGCGGGPGRLFAVELKTGKLVRLYDSVLAWPALDAGGTLSASSKEYDAWQAASKAVDTNDGPADATTLRFVTTCFQTQCPRTGAIINGGWDCAGFRRYHDGFVTSVAQTSQMRSESPRPEWKGQDVANFGSLQSCPDVAPDGSIWMTDNPNSDYMFKDDKLHLEGTRIVRMWRPDWPKEQPVNGYANQFMSPEKREELMLEYCKKYIANYAELSSIY